ncbi:MAG: hypothetical protein ACI4VP_01640 [Clostridia bacterium]
MRTKRKVLFVLSVILFLVILLGAFFQLKESTFLGKVYMHNQYELTECGHDIGDYIWEDVQDQHKGTCTICNAIVYGDHQWDEGVTTKEATCEEEGEKTYTCTICGGTKKEVIPATGHTWNEGTCTVCKMECTHKWENEAGDSTGECKICGLQCKHEEWESVTSDLHACTICNYAARHIWNDEEIKKEATCEETGIKRYTCTLCGKTKEETIPATGHTEVIDEAVEATCTETGLTEGKHCSVCNEVIVAQEVVPALGHSYSEEFTIDKEATCVETGSKSKHCTRCDEKTERTKIPATGHTEVIDEAVEATCTETGLTEGKHCSVCNEVIVAQEVVPALGHSYSEEFTIDKEATCVETGSKSKHCTRCDEKTERTKIPATGHTEVIDEAVEATCTETGLTEGKHCSVCNEVIVEQKVVQALGHSFTNYVSNNDATCAKDGTKTAKCDRCEEKDTKADEGSKKPHTEVIDEAVEATCTETGLTEGKHCSVCNEVIVAQETVPELRHNYSEEFTIDKEATCGETGSKSKHCTRCDEKTEITEIPATGKHTWDNGKVTKEATCTEDGEKTYTCTVCRETKTEIIGKLGHNYENGKCIRCGQEEPKVTITSDEYEIDTSKLYITNIQPKTTVENFKNKLETNATKIEIYKDNTLVENSSFVKTGMIIKLQYEQDEVAFTLIVRGDVDKNGTADFWDMIEINQHRLGIDLLDDVCVVAGNVDETDNELGFWDIIKINEYRLNKKTML